MAGSFCARWQRDFPSTLPSPRLDPAPPSIPALVPTAMSLSHSALLFHTIAPRKSNPPQVGRVKINAWWKVPRGKLIGSPGRFFNHNRLWRPPGLSVFAQGFRGAGGGDQRPARAGGGEHLPRGSPRGRRGRGACLLGPCLAGDRVVLEGGLEPQTWFASSFNASCWLPLGKSLRFSEPQFPLLEDRAVNCAPPSGSLWG